MKGTLTDDYQRFLESKRVKAPAVGFNPCAINPMLFPFQEKIVDWATLRGRATIFNMYKKHAHELGPFIAIRYEPHHTPPPWWEDYLADLERRKR